MDRALNFLIFAAAAVAALRDWREDGLPRLHKLRFTLRYFTMQSNLLCGLSALCLCLWPRAGWAWGLKYLGTFAVTVTLLTVLLFLGPTMGYGPLLTGPGFIMHLFNPVLAILTFCLLERRPLGFPGALWGMVPGLLYGFHYAWRILLAPPGWEWEDFYGFNRGGRWPVAAVLMTAGAAALCGGFAALMP